MSTHQFDTEIAKKVGPVAAILFSNIQFWCARAEANGRNHHDGRHWVYNSISAWKKLFEYLTEKQIRNGLDKLEESGLIVKGCYNKDPRDRTNWYAVKSGEMHLPQRANENCPEGQMSFAPEGEPLPDNNPDNNPNDNTSASVRDVFKFYNETAKRVGWVVHAKLTDAIKSPLNARIEDYGADRVKQFIEALTEVEWTYKGFRDKPDFRASLVYITRPRTFAEHFDKLVTSQPEPDLLSSAETRDRSWPIELETSFRVLSEGGDWIGDRYGHPIDPRSPDARYPADLYELFPKIRKCEAAG